MEVDLQPGCSCKAVQAILQPLNGVDVCSYQYQGVVGILHDRARTIRRQWVLDVAEPPKLSRLKCVNHHHKGNISLNALQTEQFLVCRVTSRYNHRFSDRTSIPRTKASSEILQQHTLQYKLSSDYKPVQDIITKPNLVKQLYKP